MATWISLFGCLKSIKPVPKRVCVPALTDEVCLASVDGVLQLVGGDAELVLRRPVNSDGVMGGGAQLFSDGWWAGSYM